MPRAVTIRAQSIALRSQFRNPVFLRVQFWASSGVVSYKIAICATPPAPFTKPEGFTWIQNRTRSHIVPWFTAMGALTSIVSCRNFGIAGVNDWTSSDIVAFYSTMGAPSSRVPFFSDGCFHRIG